MRNSHNYTQEELAEKIKISRQAISKWETKKSLPDLEVLLQLSKLYHITINEILEPQIKGQIADFEDIISIQTDNLKSILLNFTMEDIIKAAMGASPEITQLLEQMFTTIDFNRIRIAIGSIRVEEVETIQNQIVSMININHIPLSNI